MKTKIFIDANIYLPFYESNASEFRKLLKTLKELKDDIIVTQQIIDEVNRNSFNLFKGSFDNYAKNAKIVNVQLPIHICKGMDDKVKNWNQTRNSLKTKLDETNNIFIEIRDKVLEQVYFGKDYVSLAFKDIFVNRLIPTMQEKEAAMFRKMVKNPPGKNSDPLGDQLNWIQLMGCLKDIDKLWIVVKDKDYFISWNNKEKRLLPFLNKELKTLYPKIEVEIHDNLTDALKSYNEFSKSKLKTLPNNSELTIIGESESFASGSTASYIYPTGSEIQEPIKQSFCSLCLEHTIQYYMGSSFDKGKKRIEYLCFNCGSINYEEI